MLKEPLLDPLLDIINSSVKVIQAQLSGADLPEPWLSAPEFHPWDEETPPTPYWNARRDLLAALGMMTAVVQNPKERIVCDATSYQYSSALNLVCKARIPDILAESDVDQLQGLPVETLALRSGINAVKLDRIMRFLCAHHIFEERATSTFANNRLSRALYHDCEARGYPICWSGGFSAASPLLPSVLTHPSTKDSFDPKTCALALALREDKNQDPFDEGVKTSVTFDYMARPENKEIREAFGQGMHALETVNGKGGWLDFPWSRFDAEGGTIVDLGSGPGHLAISILPAIKHSVLKNFDRPEVCKQGEEFAEVNARKAYRGGQITFEPIDFFKDEIPVKGANAYILSNILHDWDRSKALDILARVKRAMSDDSRLLVAELIVGSFITQHDKPQQPKAVNGDVNGAKGGHMGKQPPYPLLNEWGVANRYAVLQCLEILSVMNAVDRTWEEYANLFEEAGLHVVQVHRIKKSVSIVELKKSP